MSLTAYSVPVFLAGAKIRASGCRVMGLREATACRTALDAVAASWTIGSEEDGPVQHRAGCRVNVADLRDLAGGCAPVPGGRSSAEPADGRASGAAQRHRT